MQVNVEKLSPVLVELQIQIPATRVKSEVDKAYAALQKTAKIRGFRPGKAPRDVLVHVYGGRVHADVAQRLIDETFGKALGDIQPLSEPSFAPGSVEPSAPFSYKVRFEVRPEIESVTFEGLPAKRPSVQVTDDLIDAEIQRLRREHSTLQAPAEERPSKTGDSVTMSFRLTVDGQVKGDPSNDVDAELGGGTVMKELDEALTGMRAGEEKDVEISFSERHPNPELRGKTGTFHLTLKEVKERVFPDVDDELAKDCGEDSLEKLRASIKDRLEKELKQRADESVAEQLVAELCKQNPVPVPPTVVDQQAQATERELLTQARRMGQRLDITPEIRAKIRAEAENKVRAGILMAEIARIKSVSISNEDIEKGYAELAEQTGKNVAKIKVEYRDGRKREELIGMIMEDKILNVLEAAAAVS